MVVDFHDFKDKVSTILDKYDHTTLLNPTDESSIKFFKDAGYRTEFIASSNLDPTAEVFCKFLFKAIESVFGELIINFVRIWENDNSYAEYSE
jgi:6-pyruvoyl-tetrahydropterin synthase